MDSLRRLIVSVRPSGVLTVDQMAEAISHDRNYVDSVWSSFGDTQQGKQTRITPADDVADAAKAATWGALNKAAKAQTTTAEQVTTARAERDRVVAMVYASRILGPSAIASVVGIDRNHVLRIARKAGVAPVHRTSTKNQYSEGVVPKQPSRSKRRKLDELVAQVAAAEAEAEAEAEAPASSTSNL
jgi:hypothetical protein